MYLDDTTLEVAEIRRVLKIAQTPAEVERSVLRLNIEDREERSRKFGYLLAMGAVSTYSAIKWAAREPALDLLFGQPRLVEFRTGRLSYGALYNLSYTQDLTTPIGDLLATLDINNEHDLRIGCQLIDNYIDAQLLLCSYGLCDPGFKFTDNCAQSIPAPFDDSFINFRVIDLGELSSDIAQFLDLIQKEDWRDIVNRSEYTQLPSELQEYFNDALKQRLTSEAVTKIWHTRIASKSAEAGYDSSADAIASENMIDYAVPSEIAVILRRQSNEAR